jgi:hypothetical protein
VPGPTAHPTTVSCGPAAVHPHGRAHDGPPDQGRRLARLIDPHRSRIIHKVYDVLIVTNSNDQGAAGQVSCDPVAL